MASRFGSSTTTEDVLKYYGSDLTGKNVIVTGANTGLGKETVRALVSANATVFLACRDTQKCQSAIEEIKKSTGKENLFAEELDLGSLESVKKFTSNFNKKQIPLHILINNAGVMATPKSKTKDGFEMQMGTNHIGHFVLTTGLLESLRKGSPSRVVVLSSGAHKMGNLNLDDMFFEKTSYAAWGAYGNSKLANILFAREFNKKYSGEGIKAVSVHPGVIETELSRYMGFMGTLFRFFGRPFFKSVEQGAATSVYCAVSPDVEDQSGSYFQDCKMASTSHAQINDDMAEKLWKWTEKIIA